jgi:hypothetical protein
MSQLEQSRHAHLKFERGPTGLALKAQVPVNLSAEDFGRVAVSAYGLIHNLTGCNCLSGRISFVVEEIYSEVINVNLDERGGFSAP